ncbi:MAG: hypothetical protein M3N97_13675 [Pseudomonadota bacterium]|nr:hypothetical protein [Pseudomonadota bacterium]
MKRAAARYRPLTGILVGLGAAAVYWLAAQFWPSSVAVMVSLFATAWLDEVVGGDNFANLPIRWTDLFALLVKYNVLMALTAAHLGFAVPANVALGVVMVCGQAASRALLVAVLALRTGGAERGADAHQGGAQRLPQASTPDVMISLVLGFAPAGLLGIPGLTGLAAATVMGIGLAAYLKRNSPSARVPLTVRQSTELCFYLGALATWKYV